MIECSVEEKTDIEVKAVQDVKVDSESTNG